MAKVEIPPLSIDYVVSNKLTGIDLVKYFNPE
jgi:hypothetical protein